MQARLGRGRDGAEAGTAERNAGAEPVDRTPRTPPAAADPPAEARAAERRRGAATLARSDRRGGGA